MRRGSRPIGRVRVTIRAWTTARPTLLAAPAGRPTIATPMAMGTWLPSGSRSLNASSREAHLVHADELAALEGAFAGEPPQNQSSLEG